MKNIRYYLALLFTPALWCCGQDVVYELPDSDKYDNVYLMQAVDYPCPTKIFMLEEQVQTAYYSAFYSGLKAPKDIRITFEVAPDLVAAYNEANQTKFKVMPEGSYTLETTHAAIPAGESRTNRMKINLYTFGYIEAFEEYLLPLVMKTDDAKVNEKLNVVYYQISASYEPGNVPRYEVGSNVAEAIELFSYNDNCLLTRSADGKLRRYGYDADQRTFAAPTIIKTDWTKEAAPLLSAGRANTIQLVNRYYTWIVLPGNDEGTWFEDIYTANPIIITGGCGVFDYVVPNAHTTGFIARMGGNGSMQMYGMTSDWKGLSGNNPNTPLNFSNYKNIFAYGSDLLAIDPAGEMWLHRYSAADGRFGNPIKTGSGWEDFTHVTSFGTDLVARDAEGKLWLYEFDLRGFWALK